MYSSSNGLTRKRSVPYAPSIYWGTLLRSERLSHCENFIAKSSDGLSIVGVATGNRNGPAIIFAHGFSQCHLAWRRQLSDPHLLDRFRLIAYDMRGHGGSDKPIELERYNDDKLWADDLAAVIATTNVRRPLLVLWSYAGRILSDYLKFYDQDSLSGVNYVAAVTKSDQRFWGPELAHTTTMASDDLTTSIRASRKLVHACFAQRPTSDELEMTFAYTMLVPAKVRRNLLNRPKNYGQILSKLRTKVLVSHGSLDRLVLPTAGEYTASVVARARLSIYRGVGHSPFFEDARRFNRELCELAESANG